MQFATNVSLRFWMMREKRGQTFSLEISLPCPTALKSLPCTWWNEVKTRTQCQVHKLQHMVGAPPNLLTRGCSQWQHKCPFSRHHTLLYRNPKAVCGMWNHNYIELFRPQNEGENLGCLPVLFLQERFVDQWRFQNWAKTSDLWFVREMPTSMGAAL